MSQASETPNMSDERTTVTIYGDTWERLNQRKERGDSMDDVINELLDIAEEQEEDRS